MWASPLPRPALRIRTGSTPRHGPPPHQSLEPADIRLKMRDSPCPRRLGRCDACLAGQRSFFVGQTARRHRHPRPQHPGQVARARNGHRQRKHRAFQRLTAQRRDCLVFDTLAPGRSEAQCSPQMAAFSANIVARQPALGDERLYPPVEGASGCWQPQRPQVIEQCVGVRRVRRHGGQDRKVFVHISSIAAGQAAVYQGLSRLGAFERPILDQPWEHSQAGRFPRRNERCDRPAWLS